MADRTVEVTRQELERRAVDSYQSPRPNHREQFCQRALIVLDVFQDVRHHGAVERTEGNRVTRVSVDRRDPGVVAGGLDERGTPPLRRLDGHDMIGRLQQRQREGAPSGTELDHRADSRGGDHRTQPFVVVRDVLVQFFERLLQSDVRFGERGAVGASLHGTPKLPGHPTQSGYVATSDRQQIVQNSHAWWSERQPPI